MSRSAPCHERGETLVELLVALTILGIAGVAIVAGLEMSVRASDEGRKAATGGAYVRSFAEAIQTTIDTNAGYAACASAASTYQAVAVPDLPAGYVKAVASVQSWKGSAWGACDSNGVQRVNLSVTSTGDARHSINETLTVVLRKPCNGAADAAGDDPCTG